MVCLACPPEIWMSLIAFFASSVTDFDRHRQGSNASTK
jgi:hypothetical protein